MAKQNSREDKVIEAVSNMDKRGDGLIRLSTGVVLKPRRIPNLMFAEVVRFFKRPKVPVVYIEDIGREEENPNDPAYQEAVAAYTNELSMAIVDLMIVSGTEINSVPKGFPKPEDDSWYEEFDAVFSMFGHNDTLTTKKRYLKWVKFCAAPTEQDIASIMEGVGRLSGVSEEDVSDAITRFRDSSER